MTTIKIVASITRLCKDDPNRVSASLVPRPVVRKKLNVPRDLLNLQDELDELARRKRRYLRLNGRISEAALIEISAGIYFRVASFQLRKEKRSEVFFETRR